jgi:hypothetical protein
MDVMKNITKIQIGNDPWSKLFIETIKELPRYKTCLEWINNINIPIEETTYYNHYLNILNNQKTIWNGTIKTKEQLIRQTYNFKDMFLKAPNWHHSSKDIIEDNEYFYGDLPCKIKSNGDIELYDGYHRTCICLAKNLPFYLNICYREPEWEYLKQELELLYPNKNLYQRINHPDFKNWNCSHDLVQENIIKDIVKSHNIKSVIDCGVCHGDTLYQIRDLIDWGIGIEYHPIRFQITKKLFDKIRLLAVQDDIVSFINRQTTTANSIFCLNVLHHVMRDNSIEDFTALLKKIKTLCSCFIYSLPTEDESQFKWMYSNIDAHKYIFDTIGFENKKVFKMQKRDLILLY